MNRTYKHLSVCITLAFLLLTIPVQSVFAARVLYARPDGKEDGECNTWANACTLQTALGKATSGDEIWVMKGTHKPTTGTDRTATFQLKSGVAIYGGFNGTENTLGDRDWLSNETLLSGNIGETGNSYHVVTGSGVDITAILNGFTITRGSANKWPLHDIGGGMYIDAGSPTITNVIFRGNFASSYGGGMYNNNGSPILTSVIFSGNSAQDPAHPWAGDGGGIYNNGGSPSLINVNFENNHAGGSGGGMVNRGGNPTLINVTFSQNYTESDFGGGGMFNDGNANLMNVSFIDNSTSNTGSGGGMYNYGNPTLINVTFSNNRTNYFGGGMYNNGKPILTNVTFSGNFSWSGGSGSGGSGIYNDNNSTPSLYNVIFANGDDCFGMVSSPSGNNLFGVVTNTCGLENGKNGNIIGINPLLGLLRDFDGPGMQVFPLQVDSPAIDTGNDNYCPDTDQRGVARPQGEHCDIGAYEVRIPISNNQTVSTKEDTPIDITLTGSGGEGTLTFAIVSSPARGSLSGNPPNVTYTPDENYNGTDSFTFRVNDGFVDSAPATVRITITPVNDTPVLDVNKPLETSLGSNSLIKNIYLHVWDDPEYPSNTITYTLVTLPENGSLRINRENLTKGDQFTQADIDNSLIHIHARDDIEIPEGESIIDGFTFTATDKEGVVIVGESVKDGQATFEIKIFKDNRPPVPHDDSYFTDEDATLTIDSLSGLKANDYDAEGNTLTVSLSSGPSHGALNLISDGSFTYTPTGDFNGSDSFIYAVTDNEDDETHTKTASVTITVRPVNDPPEELTLNNKSIDENKPAGTVIGFLSASDVDLDPDLNAEVTDNLFYTLTPDQPDNVYFQIIRDENGAYQLASAVIFDHESQDSYTIGAEVSDKQNATATAEFDITINNVNEFPASIQLSNDTITEELPVGTLVGRFLGTDPDGDKLSYQLTSGSGDFTITENGDIYQLRSNREFNYDNDDGTPIRTSNITVQVSDGNWSMEFPFTISILDDIRDNTGTMCGGGTTYLVGDENTPAGVWITSKTVSNSSATGCKFSGQIHVRIPGDEIGNDQELLIEGTVYKDGDREKVSLDQISELPKLSVAGFEFIARDVILEYYANNPQLTIKHPFFKTPDAWGGMGATIPNPSIIDSSGLKVGSPEVPSFMLPAIQSASGFKLNLNGQLIPVSGGYKIHAEGEFTIPNIKLQGVKSQECGLNVGVTIGVNEAGATKMELRPLPVSAVSSPQSVVFLNQMTIGMSCSRGIPIGTTGFALTGVQGTVTLTEGNDLESIRLDVTVATVKQLKGYPLLQADAGMEVKLQPSFALTLDGTLQVLVFEMADASATITANSFSARLEIDIKIATGVVTVNAWTSSDEKFHFTGSGIITLGVPTYGWGGPWCVSYPCGVIWCEKWGIPYPCGTVSCQFCTGLPPIDLTLGSSACSIGEFTNGAYGLKGYVQYAGRTYGYYIDDRGNLDLGDVSQYQLAEPDMNLRSREFTRFEMLEIVAMAAESSPTNPSFEIEGEKNVIFLVEASGPLDVSLVAPDGTEINPGNAAGYGQYKQDSITRLETFETGSEGDALPQLRFVAASHISEYGRFNIQLDGEAIFYNIGGDAPEQSDYFSIAAGEHTLSIVPVGSQGEPISVPLIAEPNQAYTLITYGELEMQMAILVDEIKLPPAEKMARVRFVNESNIIGTLSIGENEIQACSLTGNPAQCSYQDVPTGEFDLAIMDVDTPLSVPRQVKLEENKSYTFVAAPVEAEEYTLSLLQSEARPMGTLPKLRFVSASPNPVFAQVDIQVDGETIFYNIGFEDPEQSDYVSIAAGEHTLSIVPVGSLGEPISVTFIAEPNQAYTLLIYDTPDTQAAILVDETKESLAGKSRVRFVNGSNLNGTLSIGTNEIQACSLTGNPAQCTYQDVLKGEFELAIKDGSTFLSVPRQVSLDEYKSYTFIAAPLGTEEYPLAWAQILDASYVSFTQTTYNIKNALGGTWTVQVDGDLENLGYMVNVFSMEEPPIIRNPRILDDSDLENVEVNWELESGYASTLISVYATQGPISDSDAEIPIFDGVLLGQVSVSKGDPDENNTMILDLSVLKSGDYYLWIRAEDETEGGDANPMVSGYIGGTDVDVNSDGYDPLEQLAGATKVTVEHPFPDTWTTDIRTEIDAETAAMYVEWDALPHPDVDQYLLHVTVSGEPEERIYTTGNAFYAYDENGQIKSTPIAFETIQPIEPDKTYTLQVEAQDLDPDPIRSVMSQKVVIDEVNPGDYLLNTPNTSIEVDQGAELVIPLSLVITEQLFYPDISLAVHTYDVPMGINVILERDGVPVPKPALLSEGNPLIDVRISIAEETPNGNYPITFVGYNGGLERQLEIILVMNHPPVAMDDEYTTDEDTILSVEPEGLLENDSDPDEDELHVLAIDTTGTKGIVTWNPDGSFSYDPNKQFEHLGMNETAADRFIYTVADPSNTTDEATVTITIMGVNDAPVAENDTYEVDEDTLLSVLSPGVLENDSDVEEDAITAQLDSSTAHGDLELYANGSFTYMPDENWFGVDSFNYQACDPSQACGTASVSITVVNVNDAPIAMADTAVTDEDTAVVINVAANDEDVDNNLDLASIAVLDTPSNGTLTNNFNGTLTYAPNANFNGSDTFTYKICDTGQDGDGATDNDDLCDNASVAIEILPVNDPPVITISPESQAVQYSDTILPITISADDIDSTELSIDMALPDWLTLSAGICKLNGVGVSCTWVLNGLPNVQADDYQFPLTIGDEDGGETSATVYIRVAPEDTSTIFHPGNPVAVRVAKGSTVSGPFELEVRVREMSPDQAAAGTSPQPGNIGLAQTSMTLKPVGPGDEISGVCRVVGVFGSGSAYNAFQRAICRFDSVPVNTYQATVHVDGGYYTGSDETILVVYDPSLGHTTGDGSFYWPNTNNPATGYPGDRTEFSYTIEYNKSGANIKGSLLLIRHLAGGSTYQVKSNALYGLALGVETENGETFSWGSFSGKTTYTEPGGSGMTGNDEFLVYVEDRNNVRSDRFWIEVKDKDRNLVSIISIPRKAIDTAEDLLGGGIFILR